MTATLELQDIWKVFPDGGAVLRGLSFSLAPGEIVLITGENGAGKSTVLNVAAGAQRANRGRVRLRGRQIDNLPPETRRRLGVHRMHQAPAAFQSLCVEDNVLLAFDPGYYQAFAPSLSRARRLAMWRCIRERFDELFKSCPFLSGQRGEAGELSFGQRRIVEFLGAMSALGGDGLLLLDEPFAGIQDNVAEIMWSAVRRAADAGAAVLIVEHAPDSPRFQGLRRLALRNGAAQ